MRPIRTVRGAVIVASLVLATIGSNNALATTGPYLVKDISEFGNSNPEQLTPVGGKLFFSAKGAGQGRELWVSDGTDGGTRQVRDIRSGPEGSHPDELTNVGGILYFVADGVGGRELWKSNGSAAGTIRVKNIRPGARGSEPHQLTKVRGILYFTADDGSHGRELWKSDGTDGGTDRVTDIEPGQSSSFESHGDGYDGSLTAYKGRLFFGAWDCVVAANSTDPGPAGVFCAPELRVTDGTSAGTELVCLYGEWNGEFDHVGYAMDMTTVGTKFFGLNEEWLWMTDTTNPACSQTHARFVRRFAVLGELTNVDGTLLFRAREDGPLGDMNEGIWTSDGTVAGTSLVMEIGSPTQLTSVAGQLFFTDGAGDLWRSDGTTPGTERVLDVAPGVVIANLTGAGEALYFTQDGKLWTSNGSGPGTHVVDPSGPSNAKNLTSVGGALYLTANDGVHGRELWRYVP